MIFPSGGGGGRPNECVGMVVLKCILKILLTNIFMFENRFA